MNRSNLDKLITEALAIEAQSAKEAGALGYYARVLTQATMPHSRQEGAVFKRKNGAFSLTMIADPDIGLPYGSKPRLLLSWLTTEAVRTKSREIELGDSLSSFMRSLGIVPTGGRWGSITSLKDQTKRLFACSVKAVFETDEEFRLEAFQVADSAHLWWHPKNDKQAGLWSSTVTLSERFYNEVVERPVPVDVRALRALSRSPMALDIYCWLTYRMSYLSKPVSIPWEALQVQFGAEYAETKTFKFQFLKQLRAVLTLYPHARLSDTGEMLSLLPSPSHVPVMPVSG